MLIVYVKYKCFLHGGFSWNGATVLDIIGTNSDIRMLAESMNLFLFSTMSEIDASDSIIATAPASIPQAPSSKKDSEAGLKALSDQKQGRGTDSSFLFWKRKSPGSPVSTNGSGKGKTAAVVDASDFPTVTYSDFLLSLLTCSPVLSDASLKSSNGEVPLSPLLGGTGSHSLSGVQSSDNVQSIQSAGSNSSKSSLAEAERIMWGFVTASNLEEFVTCRGTRRVSHDSSRRDTKKAPLVDGYAPTKSQAMDVLKQYRRALQGLGWKLDRKKIAAMRERGTGAAANSSGPSTASARAQGILLIARFMCVSCYSVVFRRF